MREPVRLPVVQPTGTGGSPATLEEHRGCELVALKGMALRLRHTS